MQTRAIAYSQFWRVVVGALVVVSRAGLLALVVAILFFETRLDNPLRLLRTFALVSLAPGFAAWLLMRAFATVVVIADGMLVVQRRDQRIEIPCASIVGIDPWSIPLPAGGLWLRLRSGRRFREGLQVADPIALIQELAAAGAADDVLARTRHPAVVHAASRHDPRRRWYHPWLKFAAFALVPTLPVFRLHQWIAYGGTFGEYHTYGLQAYVLGFAAFWWTFTIYLVLYAAVLRTVAETVMLAIAWTSTARVETVRRSVELVYRIAYFSAVPLYLLRLAALAM